MTVVLLENGMSMVNFLCMRLEVCLIVDDLLVDTRHYRVKHKMTFLNKDKQQCFLGHQGIVSNHYDLWLV